MDGDDSTRVQKHKNAELCEVARQVQQRLSPFDASTSSTINDMGAIGVATQTNDAYPRQQSSLLDLDARVASSSGLGLCTSASAALGWGEYDVFLNHQGPHVKHTFVARLDATLRSAGFRPFSNVEFGHGAFNSHANVLNGVQVHVVVFSPRYADSKYCLNDLCDILASQKPVIPIFYRIKPQDLRWLDNEGQFAKAFARHLDRGRDKDVMKWKKAMKEASNIVGFEFGDNDNEGNLIRKVVKAIKIAIPPTGPLPSRYLIGLDKTSMEVMSMLHNNKRVIGICGTGGIGKTTLAKEVFCRMRSSYHESCFLKDVRSKKFMVSQSKMVTKLIGRDALYLVRNYDRCFKIIQEKKVLLVVDDISETKQFYKLIPNLTRLATGSKVIITSRDRDFLNNIMANVSLDDRVVYDMPRLDYSNSMELFINYAFHKRYLHEVDATFHQNVKEVTEACDGLPLALEVIGASFSNINDQPECWRETILQLQKEKSAREVFNQEKSCYESCFSTEDVKDVNSMDLRSKMGTNLIGKDATLVVGNKLDLKRFDQKKYPIISILQLTYDNLPSNRHRGIFLDVALHAPRRQDNTLASIKEVCEWLSKVYHVHFDNVLQLMEDLQRDGLLERWEDLASPCGMDELHFEFAKAEASKRENYGEQVYHDDGLGLPETVHTFPPHAYCTGPSSFNAGHQYLESSATEWALTGLDRPDSTDVAEGNAAAMEKLALYLRLGGDCVATVQRISSLKFNDEQCGYLADKLQIVVRSASLFLKVLRDDLGLSIDVAKVVEVFEFLFALAKQIESFVQGCCKDSWIQSAMTLTNVEEYVALVGFNLELCKETFCQSRSRCLTLEEVEEIHKVEVEIVKKKVFSDVDALSQKILLEGPSLSDENKDLAFYLLQRLNRVKPIPSAMLSKGIIGYDGGVFQRLFRWVKSNGQLGRGASGTVDKASWLGTPVAKKTFFGQENPDFTREVEVLSALSHSNVMSIFCAGKNPRGCCSIYMELMDKDLHNLMERRLEDGSCPSPFPILGAVDIMLQIGEGGKYLHEQGIAHRDLKSMNILTKNLSGEELDGYVHVKVADFGLSKTKEKSTTFAPMSCNVGTSRWMAPEIIRLNGSDQGSSSSIEGPKHPFKRDIYSFGMVCFEILTGQIPFSVHNEREAKRGVLQGKRPELPEDPHKCPRLLKGLIERCWSSNPEERPTFVDICKEMKYLKYSLMRSYCSGETIKTNEKSRLNCADNSDSVELFSNKCKRHKIS